MTGLSSRNDAIVAAYLRGETRASLARKHGIGVTRVAEIITRAAVRASHLVDDFPRSLAEGRDWQRTVIEYAAKAHAADPEMAIRRAAAIVADRDKERRKYRDVRKAETKARRERIRAQNKELDRIIAEGQREAYTLWRKVIGKKSAARAEHFARKNAALPGGHPDKITWPKIRVLRYVFRSVRQDDPEYARASTIIEALASHLQPEAR